MIFGSEECSKVRTFEVMPSLDWVPVVWVLCSSGRIFSFQWLENRDWIGAKGLCFWQEVQGISLFDCDSGQLYSF